jgi:hypothetical protein
MLTDTGKGALVGEETKAELQAAEPELGNVEAEAQDNVQLPSPFLDRLPRELRDQVHIESPPSWTSWH